MKIYLLSFVKKNLMSISRLSCHIRSDCLGYLKACPNYDTHLPSGGHKQRDVAPKSSVRRVRLPSLLR